MIPETTEDNIPVPTSFNPKKTLLKLIELEAAHSSTIAVDNLDINRNNINDINYYESSKNDDSFNDELKTLNPLPYNINDELPQLITDEELSAVIHDNYKTNTFKINIKTQNNGVITLNKKCTKYTSVLKLKQIILDELDGNDINDIILKMNGDILKNDDLLCDYNILNSNNMVRLLIRQNSIKLTRKNSVINGSNNKDYKSLNYICDNFSKAEQCVFVVVGFIFICLDFGLILDGFFDGISMHTCIRQYNISKLSHIIMFLFYTTSIIRFVFLVFAYCIIISTETCKCYQCVSPKKVAIYFIFLWCLFVIYSGIGSLMIFGESIPNKCLNNKYGNSFKWVVMYNIATNIISLIFSLTIFRKYIKSILTMIIKCMVILIGVTLDALVVECVLNIKEKNQCISGTELINMVFYLISGKILFILIIWIFNLVCCCNAFKKWKKRINIIKIICIIFGLYIFFISIIGLGMIFYFDLLNNCIYKYTGIILEIWFVYHMCVLLFIVFLCFVKKLCFVDKLIY